LGAVSAGIVPLLLGGAGLLWAYLSHRQMEAKRAQVKAHYAKLRQQAGDALRACLAEVVELRRDIAIRDDVSARVTQLLEGISPEQHVLSSHDSVRRVMLKA
jgi:hypothetical protein